MSEFYPYFLPNPGNDRDHEEIVLATDINIEFTDLELIMLFRNKPRQEIQDLFNKQVTIENYEGAHQIQRVVNLLNSKVCKYHLQKPLILKVN